jgi:hypothetical protein
MQSRAYALAVATIGAGVFLAVIAANVVLDPQAVFGTGLFGNSPNANSRYRRLVAYQAEPQRYDGLLFGSSRARAIPRHELSRRLQGIAFADFAVDFGGIADHLPALEYVVKEKAARGEPLRAVFLLLDADAAGLRPKANKFIQTLLPPELTGESPARFWWRNLTAIQFAAWQSSIRAALGWTKPGGLTPNWKSVSRDGPAELLALIVPPAQAEDAAPARSAAAEPRLRITNSIYFEQQIQLLQQFVALCRQHGIMLMVATSPINPRHAATFAPGEIEAATDGMSRIVPLWDFSAPNALLDDPQRWTDPVHFDAKVAQMMLGRILDDEVPSEWRDFGRLRPRNSTAVSSR